MGLEIPGCRGFPASVVEPAYVVAPGATTVTPRMWLRPTSFGAALRLGGMHVERRARQPAAPSVLSGRGPDGRWMPWCP